MTVDLIHVDMTALSLAEVEASKGGKCVICERPVVAGNVHAACSKNARRSWRSGAEAAAAVAADYDRLSSHDHLVSDCILGKLNIRRRRPRRNPDKFKNNWLNGFGFGLASVCHEGYGDGVDRAAQAAGVSLADLKAAGLDPYDLKELRKVLPKPEKLTEEPVVQLAKATLRNERRKEKK